MLELNQVQFRLGRMSILNGITFSVREGERVGIIGPNGSGKTTLFNCLSGFHLPSGGEIRFRGQDITLTPPYERARAGLGRVFQNFGIFKEMTVQENILAALESKQRGLNLPFSKQHRANLAQAVEHLKLIRLEAKAGEKAGSLSGGQMRLLEIARALAFGAELFLLDEPTAGVSPKMKGEVEQLLLTLQEQQKTVLIIEHDLNFIQRLCDRIIVLDSGKVALDGTPEEIRQSELLREIYFGANTPTATSHPAESPSPAESTEGR